MKRKSKKKLHLTAVLGLSLALLVAFTGCGRSDSEETTEQKPSGPPAPAVYSTATISSTGDFLIHSPLYEAAYDASTGTYDFSEDFQAVASYYEKADLMVGNLEVTFGGEENGYRSYPLFNCPDGLATSLKNAGVDLVMTANNHSYDSGYSGIIRTLEVCHDAGLDTIGTREDESVNYLVTTMINDIKIGMVCYTYDTREYTDEVKSLNGITMEDAAQPLVNSFSYEHLDEFYADVQQNLDYMEMLGIEANVFYIHWGSEYQEYSNEQQQEIAQHLCDMGVDVIVGGHPHVVQEFDVLTNAEGHQTVCIYSMGNEISNQRKEYMDSDYYRGYTEDGMIFSVTFEKLNNGRVRVQGVEITPTWVDLTSIDGQTVYLIVPLDSDLDVSEWAQFGVDDLGSAVDSYNRTMSRVGEEYNLYRESKRLPDDPMTLSY